MLNLSISIDKDEVIISIYSPYALKPSFLLIFSLHDECLFYTVHHRDSPMPCFRLWRVDAEIAAFFVPMVIVDERMIDGDLTFLQVHITPTETCNLTYTHSGIQHDVENRIPVLVLRTPFEEAKQQCFLLNRQRLSLLCIERMGESKLFHGIERRVAPYHIVLNRYLKDLVKNIVDVHDS